MSEQKALKKRLKALMALPQNQICSDCPEKKPTWASLIVPPPGAPPGTQSIGAFCCLECSGSHRRLGVHISFVRSVNLDSWKVHEVQAMENGGNAKVNAIFEANLASSGRPKPTNLADGPTRERFIRDKYERRKFYDPSAYSMTGNAGGGAARSSNSSSIGAPTPSPGAPSEIARQRVARHQARMKTSHSQMETPTAQTSKPQIAQAPVSAPVVLDLLDFGSVETTPAPTAFVSDPFAAPPATNMAPPADAKPNKVQVNTPLPPPPTKESKEKSQTQNTTTNSVPGQEFLTPAPAAPQSQPATASNESIMALFNPPTSSNSGFAIQTGMGGMVPNNNMGMMPGMQQQPMTGGMMGGMMNQGVQQQQQQQPMMNGSLMGNTQMNPQMTAMMNNNMQQQFMMQQQQMPYQMQQQTMAYNMGQGYNTQMNQNSAGSNMNSLGNNNNFDSMTQGFHQMNFGGASNVQSQNQSREESGFGSPMGGGNASSSATSNDPFSSLGGMNAFR